MPKVGDSIMFYCVTCRKKHKGNIKRFVVKSKRKFAVSECTKNDNAMWKIIGRA